MTHTGTEQKTGGELDASSPSAQSNAASTADAEEASPPNPPSLFPDPLFIVYKSRSGSTFFADLLSQHPAIGLAPESKLLSYLLHWSYGGKRPVTAASLDEALDLLYQDPRFQSWELPRAALREHIARQVPLSAADFARCVIQRYCRKHHPGCVVWGLKKGEYLHRISDLRALFPQAKFVHILRDGRAVFASSKRACYPGTGEPFETDAEASAIAWVETVETFRRVREERLALEVQYEDLVMNPVSTLRRLLAFLDVATGDDVIKRMIEPHGTNYVLEQHEHLHENVGQVPDTSRIHGWKEELPEEEVRAFEHLAGATLKREGYELMYPRRMTDEAYARWIWSREGVRRAGYHLRGRARAYAKALCRSAGQLFLPEHVAERLAEDLMRDVKAFWLAEGDRPLWWKIRQTLRSALARVKSAARDASSAEETRWR